MGTNPENMSFTPAFKGTKPHLLVPLLLWLVLPAGATPPAQIEDSLMAVRYYRMAESNFREDSLDPALENAVDALQLAMRSNLKNLESKSLLLIADIYDQQERHGDAIPYFMRLANIQEAAGDTPALFKTYTRIAECYRFEEVYHKEAEYFVNALGLADDQGRDERAVLNEKIGLALLKEDLPDSALMYYKSSRMLYGETGPADTRILQHMVRACNQGERYREALEYNRLLFGRQSEITDYARMSALKNNIGYNLTRLGKYRDAAVAYTEAISYGEQASLPGDELAFMKVNNGICNQNIQNQETAKILFREAIGLFGETARYREKSRTENILAMVYYREGDLYNAGQFSRNAIESAEQGRAPQELSDACLTYSRVLREGNDPIQALEFYERYLSLRDSLALENRLEEQIRERRRQELEKSEKDLKIKLKEEQVRELAIQQLTLQLEKEEQEKELMRREKDMQLLEQERLRQSLIITEQRNAAEKQKRENQILEQENRISELRLAQEQQKQREQEQEITLLEQQTRLDQLELNRQRTAKKVLIGFSILGLLITGLIVASLVSSRKKNILLARQKEEIEEKNTDLESKNEEISAQRDEIEAQRDLVYRQKEEIEQYNAEVMKSIEYARKIQSSALPDLSSLNTSISEFFLLFRPRDIVSGDFFWTASIENSTVLTVSDCTGHGVPGAFMSMLGMSLLKEIVQKEYITQPGVILRRLRKGIITALGQKGISGEQRDGMDMALITIDHAAGSIQYAGAYNPLYLARNKTHKPPQIENMTVFEEEFGNGYILYEIKAEKMPIGFFVRMDKFSTRELEIRDGDNFYMFTDGYADQFGGPMGKKFKYKPFKRLILQNAHLSMEEQKSILDRTLEEWMGDIAQVDDICMMGLRMQK